MMKRRYHIIIDAWDVNPKLLNDPILIEEVACELVKKCKMKILHGPVVLQGVPENPGITCFTVIDFSHISIHTFTKAKEICVDIFSCKKYNYKKVKDFVCFIFQLDPAKTKYIEVKYQDEL